MPQDSQKVSEYQRRYRAAHRDTAREYNKAYHAANRERRREYDRARRAAAKALKAPKAAPDQETLQARRVRKVLTTKALKYGMTAETLTAWYAATWAAQGGCCAVCLQAFDGSADEFTFSGRDEGPGPFVGQAVIEHDHATKRLRGLTCSACNTLVGRIEKNLPRAVAAAGYLLTHAEQSLDSGWPAD